MADDRFRYDQYVDEALRGVARRVLRDIARDGLTGNHHFYISFRTGAPGVSIPEYLRSRYPEEITVVLQHQFWGLEIDDKQFSVTVSFNKQNERLTVPFAALTAFVDPSVRFGLQFEDLKAESGAPTAPQAVAPATTALSGPRPSAVGKSNGGKLAGSSRNAARDKENESRDVPPSAAKSDPAPAVSEAGAKNEGKAEGKGDAASKVVTLDAFRKK